MSTERLSSFEDPALKSAVKRAAGGETAPAALRQRVQRALAAEPASPVPEAASAPIPIRASRGWRSNPLTGLAAAALLIIGIGLIFNHYWEPGGSFDDGLPVAMAADMVDSHNRALSQPVIHDLPVAKTDLDQLRAVLGQRLGHSVLVATLGEGWELAGARITDVGHTPASQLVFRRGEDAVSIFSVSGAAYYATHEGMEYKQTQDGHPIAGFVQGGVVHCVVGSKGTKLKEKDLAHLRDAVRPHVTDPFGVETSSRHGAPCGGAVTVASR